jgi:hypothetical protein
VPAIRTLLDLSTAHLPEQICDRLGAIPGVIAHQTAYGWLVFVPNHPDQPNAHTGAQVPEVVLTILRYARAAGRDTPCSRPTPTRSTPYPPGTGNSHPAHARNLLEDNDMTTVHEYMTLGPAQRDRVRSAVRDLAVGTNERYADLLAAEAVLTAKAVYPDVHRLVFRLGEDVTGTTATLVAAYDRDATRLWHVDRDGEWPDESEVTDLLAGSVDWCDGQYPFTDAREDTDHDEYELPAVATAPRVRPTGADQ